MNKPMRQLNNPAIQHQKKEQAYKRNQKARHLIRQGLELFAKARADKYQDKKLVRLACHKWMDAIQINRMAPKPYLFLAQVFITFKSYNQARKYLYEVKKLTPNDPDLLVMMDIVGEPAPQPDRAVPTQADKPAGKATETNDIDALYDKVEGFLDHKVNTVIESKKLPDMPTILAEEIDEMKETLQDLRSTCQSVQMKLDILGKELSITELVTKFNPLVKLKSQFEHFIEVSEKLRIVYSEIKVQTRNILRYVQQVQLGDANDVNIDKILDKCDEYSDKIDQIAYNNPDYFLVVEPAYDKLMAAVNRLQDEIENKEEGWLF